MKIQTEISVEVEDCLEALRDELLLTDGKFPRKDYVDKFKKLYKNVMEKWIDPKDRCLSCGGIGYHEYHSLDVCSSCTGTGKHRFKTGKMKADE